MSLKLQGLFRPSQIVVTKCETREFHSTESFCQSNLSILRIIITFSLQFWIFCFLCLSHLYLVWKDFQACIAMLFLSSRCTVFLLKVWNRCDYTPYINFKNTLASCYRILPLLMITKFSDMLNNYISYEEGSLILLLHIHGLRKKKA